ncbi:hypothetical protein ABB37_05265 [Leptomonas pyrrhocoris]|uniref:RRM domain-containing protein n=1 Tax=Leptomonas pyrrhocoris TaxID=157538 RepID=A0A0N0VF11_LEPPY|nr:hypothetical protein ABB37_05265 [Leptomonas pyrrhocoris]XP_015657864.1 hypothetical protein ABB37_05265 [Leptomonas pyrrhocoris]KPA79424.1 hypothetical protein ABB37_05265 [Leptomonas pyrrhocoris]KPA79425.1 hypothetical protein ABB37_05265 [Leptomonas pyrrhocoris]|eukprot:XP_015657863.1 hypothetical protein ABB37_05265 [Leptomonas pyrrhocoris]
MSTESSSATPAPASTPFVYVNGDKLHLMEDYRLPLYQYFPEGTKLFDPTYTPPREIPLSSSTEEAGVTLLKLQPNAQYHAFFKDPRTGALYAAATKYVCLYVSHLPFNTTTEMLGRYFETFDMVKAADVFPGPKVSCNGRGWVILQDPSKLLLIPRVLQFYGKHFIYTELSDREPSWEKLYSMVPETAPPPPPPPPPPPLPRTHSLPHRMDASPPPMPPPPPHNPNVPAPRSSLLAERRALPAALTPIGSTPDYEGPALPAPRSQQRLQRVPATGQQSVSTAGSGSGSASLTPASSANSLSKPLPGVTFVTYASEKDAEDAVRDSVFWPSPVLASEIQECLDGRASAVFIVFLKASPPTIFGYAKVLAKESAGQREAKTCPLEWVQHHCSLADAATRPFAGVALMKQRDGSQLKPEVGQHVRDFIDAQAGKAETAFAPPPPPPSGPSIPLPRGRGGVGRGGRSFGGPPPPIGRGRGVGLMGTQPPPPASSSESGLAIPIPASRRAAAAAAAASAGGSSPTSLTGLNSSGSGASPSATAAPALTGEGSPAGNGAATSTSSSLRALPASPSSVKPEATASAAGSTAAKTHGSSSNGEASAPVNPAIPAPRSTSAARTPQPTS